MTLESSRAVTELGRKWLASGASSSGTQQVPRQNSQTPRFSRRDAARIEDALERRQRDVEEMEDAIDRENKGHLKAMDRAWEKYRDEVDSEMYRYNSNVADIYETYLGRVSAHETVLREMCRKILPGESTAPEDETIGDEVTEEKRGEHWQAHVYGGLVNVRRRSR